MGTISSMPAAIGGRVETSVSRITSFYPSRLCLERHRSEPDTPYVDTTPLRRAAPSEQTVHPTMTSDRPASAAGTTHQHGMETTGAVTRAPDSAASAGPA